MAPATSMAVRQLHVSRAVRVLADGSSPARRHRSEAGVSPESDAHVPPVDEAESDKAQAIYNTAQDPTAPSPMRFEDGLAPDAFDHLGAPPEDFGAGTGGSGRPVEPAVVSIPWEVYEVEPSFFDPKAMRAPDVHPLISKMVGMMTKRGDRTKAERVVSAALARIAVATNDSPLPLFVEAIKQASPNVDTVSTKRGAKVIHTPRPLSESASAHKGIKAILKAAFRRSDKRYEDRIAKELIAVVEGRSGVLHKRLEAHKFALANRANLSVRI